MADPVVVAPGGTTPHPQDGWRPGAATGRPADPDPGLPGQPALPPYGAWPGDPAGWTPAQQRMEAARALAAGRGVPGSAPTAMAGEANRQAAGAQTPYSLAPWGSGAPRAAAAPEPAAEQPAWQQPRAAAAVVEEPRPRQGDAVTGNRRNQEGTNQSVSTWNLDPVIEMRDVAKAFGSFRVLDGVTFRIPRGGVTFLMGPSGTGKSVTLRHIVGLLMPDRGDVLVEGRNVPRLTEKEILELRRQVGMLFQDGALFSSMNLYDNVAFPLRQHTRLSEGRIREVVMSRLSEVGLAGAEKRMPNELSGGMRKRAGFARALVMEPRIILVDEPDSGLDPVRTTLLCDLIKEIAKKYQATVIVISHNIEAVRRTADYIGILYKGKMRHFGTKQEIEESPDEFVKQFFNAEPEGPLGMD